MNPKISFCVPVYNVEKYIEQCARTLFEQTLDDIEIIFVDDCTPDNSIKIVEELLKSYPNRAGQVKIVRHEVNKGLPAARKSAAMAATGEYICCVDSDDYVALDMAEQVYDFAIDQNADMVMFDHYYVNGEVVRYGTTCWEDESRTWDSEKLRQRVMDRDGVMTSVWCRCYKRELSLHPIVWPPCYMCEDEVLVMSLTPHAKKLAYLAVPFYYYRIVGNTMSRIRGLDHDVERFSQICRNIDALMVNLSNSGMERKYEKGVVSLKVSAKSYLLLYTNKLKYRKLWFNTYPETVSLMFKGSSDIPSGWKEKLWLVMIFLGLFPMLKRVLINRRFRPDPMWVGALGRILSK